MKKLLLFSTALLLFVACGTPKTVIQSKKVLKGNWTLDAISYSESGTFDVTIFNDATKDCFEGTTWRFIPNNNSGIYTVNDSDCVTGDRNFIFTVQEIDKETGLYDFLLKPTNTKGKSETNSGFRVQLAQLTESSMQWQQTVSLDGKPFTIFMNFSKTIE